MNKFVLPFSLQMGYDSYFFGRNDFADKAVRLANKTLEMVWQGSPNNLGKLSSMKL